MSKRKIAGTLKDATLPRTPVMVGGKKYDLCLDLGALSEAETAFRSKGYDVNLLNALPGQSMAGVRILFAAALQTFHPEIGFEEAQAMLGLGDLYVVADAIQQLWIASIPDRNQPSDPPQAV